MKKSQYKKLIDIKDIIKYKSYIGDNSLNKDIKNFIFGFSQISNSYIFNFTSQLRVLKQVFFLIRTLKKSYKKPKPILFFGLNKKKYNNIHTNQISLINKKIFELSLDYANKDKKKKSDIKDLIDNFYLCFYEKRFNSKKLKDELLLVKFFFFFEKKIN